MLLAARAAALAPRLPSMARSATRASVRMDAATPEQFARIDLRVGTIVDAFNHPESEKLIVEEIDLGETDCERFAGLLQGFRSCWQKSISGGELTHRQIG